MNMGFVEMPTNRWVESSFWNFDALFQPQVGPGSQSVIYICITYIIRF